MKSKALALKRTRDVLIARVGAERAVLAQQGAASRPATRMIDKGISVIRFFKSHPAALLLPIAVLTMWRPQRLLGIAASGLGLWRLMQFGRHRLR